MTSSGRQPREEPRRGTGLRMAALAHPLLFAAFPVVALLGANIEMTHPSEAVRPVLAVGGAAMLSMLGLRVLLGGDWMKAALGTTLVFVTGYAAGQVRLLFSPMGAAPTGPGSEIAAFVAWLGLAVVSLILLHRSTRLPSASHTILAVVAAAALAQPTARIVAHELQANRPWLLPVAASDPFSRRPQAEPGAPLPDIYYIILDGYGRSDVLHDLYGLDETSFLRGLEADGFYIASNSRSNYAQTSLSFASALNMRYLDDLADIAGDDISQREVARLIRFNEATEILKGLGYSVTAFATGYRRAELASADTFFVAKPGGMSPFEALLLESSALWGLRSLLDAGGGSLPYPGYSSYRDRIEANVQELWRTPAQPGPKFVFAHLLLPHPPFVFGAGGEPRQPDLPFRAADGDQFIGSDRDYVDGYRQQVAFAHHVVEVFLDRLTAAGGDSSIVIIQGDHGPGLRLDWSDPQATDTRERLSILNAIRAPGVDPGVWHAALTPVNTFRLLFDEMFGAAFPRLPDRSFFSSWRSPYDFIEYEPDDGSAAIPSKRPSQEASR